MLLIAKEMQRSCPSVAKSFCLGNDEVIHPFSSTCGLFMPWSNQQIFYTKIAELGDSKLPQTPKLCKIPVRFLQVRQNILMGNPLIEGCG
jgi:hypothetical protein